jgi:hypothetical protein
MMKSAFISALLLLSSSSISVAERSKTIVGWWGYPGSACTPAYGAISIEPMALWGDDVRCDFTSVVRKGSTVIWKGTCSYGQGNETNDTDNETVKATEIKGKLKLEFGSLKNDEPALQRCVSGEGLPQ